MIAMRAVAADAAPLFGSMFLGGFECAAHRLRSGRRLDITAATGHAGRAANDYHLLRLHGMHAARDGLRWHLIERQRGYYDWSSFLPMLRAAEATGIQPIWDLLHYGVPDHVDLFAADFADRFAAFAGAAACLVRDNAGFAPIYTPINEISFWAHAGGDTGGLTPFAEHRGPEMKRQLVRAAIAAIAAIRSVDRRATIATAEPLIHILPADTSPAARHRAAAHNESQFEALDMLLGRMQPELGGNESMIDIVGVNYYYNNQWVDGGQTVYLGHWHHRPLRELLVEAAQRYARPLYIAETGTEGVFRAGWLRYVADEVWHAIASGVPVGGICLYPIISHLGWDDDRHCANGMFAGHGADTERTVDMPMAQALAEESARFATALPHQAKRARQS